MASLHRYNVRLQAVRDLVVDAKNEQNAKEQAVRDVEEMGWTEKISTSKVELIQENTGVSAQGGIPLNRYKVKTRYRMNYITDAVDQADAVHWAKEYAESWIDTEGGSVQRQVVTFMKENTGVA